MPDEDVSDPSAIRFVYTWASDGTLELAEGTSVAMTAAPGEVDDNGDPASGFWYELRDSSAVVLWQLAAPNPFRLTVETFGDADPPATLPNDETTGVAVAVVPAMAGGYTVAVMASAPDNLEGDAVEVLTHPFEATP